MAELVRVGEYYWLFSKFLGSREGSRNSGALFCSELDLDFCEVPCQALSPQPRSWSISMLMWTGAA
jgi:hypothetical protein